MDMNQSGLGVTTPSTIDLVAAERRQVLIAYGEHYGKQLHTIVSYNPDLTYNEDVMAGKNTLRRPMEIYVIQSINITGINLIEGIDANHPAKIEFNGDPSLRYDVVPPTFKEVSCATVREAIEAYKNKKAPIFFPSSQIAQLTQEVIGANEETQREFENLAKKYLNLANTTREINESTTRKRDEYLRQVGVSNQPNVEVHVQVETA